VLRELVGVVAGWVRDERESWRLWLAWRRDDRQLRLREDELRDELRRAVTEAGGPSEYADMPSEAERKVQDKFYPLLDAIKRERALPETHFLVFEGKRLNLRPQADGWHTQRVKDELVLDSSGLRAMREAIAAERRRRREPLIAYVGLIGALTGLLAAWTAYRRSEPAITVNLTGPATPVVSEPSTTTIVATTTTTATTSSTSSTTMTMPASRQ